MILFYLIYPCLFIMGCDHRSTQAQVESPTKGISELKKMEKLGQIPVPAGYKRMKIDPNSFSIWLRQLRLKEDKTVYLYNGQPNRNQSVQFAVIDLPRSKTDLQHCADVVMRLRAEYLFSQKKYDSISFMDYNGKWYQWNGKDNRIKFENYLQNVFGWCGSASLEKQLKPVTNFQDININIGDVLVVGGFPGHAVIVADMAENNKGEKIFLLIQGYQPAQDMHVLINPGDPGLSPWYKVTDEDQIHTPECQFNKFHLKRW